MELSSEMRKKGRTVTRAAVETRATVVSDDIFGGRSIVQTTSEKQQLPTGDNRYRITHSEKFYIVQLMGSWVHVSESAERTVRYRNHLKWVRFENKEYQLRKAVSFKQFVSQFIQGGCYAYVGSKEVHTIKTLGKLEPQPFIYIAASEALKKFNDLRANRPT